MPDERWTSTAWNGTLELRFKLLPDSVNKCKNNYYIFYYTYKFAILKDMPFFG